MSSTTTTDPNPADPPPPTNPSDPPFRTITYLPTSAAYDRWSAVYDTDGNFLQALDTRELRDSGLLHHFLATAGLLSSPFSDQVQQQQQQQQEEEEETEKRLIDLGCGTGRVTLLARDALDAMVRGGEAAKGGGRVAITGLDSSEGMLGVARGKIGTLEQMGTGGTDESRERRETGAAEGRSSAHFPEITFQQADIDHLAALESSNSGSGGDADSQLLSLHHTADAIISALVLEHVPLSTFFRAAIWLLKPAGTGASSSLPAAHPPHLLLTNMHYEMGQLSQAGFVDAATGEKVRPRSYVHSVDEVRNEAERFGFEVCEVWEREVGEADVEGLGKRSAKWVGVRCWFAVLLRFDGAAGRDGAGEDAGEGP